jgi:uncharacterized protein YbaR (Trm112 family)
MHILLTDVVTCPRCGPEFGLIVLADRLEERRIVQGRLGCPNCREEFPINHGIADLRWPPVSPAPPAGGAGLTPLPEPLESDAERSYRLAALLGITGPSGPVVIVSDDSSMVAEVQRHLPDAGVVGMSREAPPGAGEAGSGWLLATSSLPFRSRSLSGVAFAVPDPLPLIDDALRCLGRGADRDRSGATGDGRGAAPGRGRAPARAGGGGGCVRPPCRVTSVPHRTK